MGAGLFHPSPGWHSRDVVESSSDLSLLLDLPAEPVSRAGNDFPLIPKGSQECQRSPRVYLCFLLSN